LSENYGDHLGIKDKEYLKHGVKIFKNDNEAINNADIIVQLGLLNETNSSLVRENQTLIGVLIPSLIKKKLIV
jgi:alanine dehydrogenase